MRCSRTKSLVKWGHCSADPSSEQTRSIFAATCCLFLSSVLNTLEIEPDPRYISPPVSGLSISTQEVAARKNSSTSGADVAEEYAFSVEQERLPGQGVEEYEGAFLPYMRPLTSFAGTSWYIRSIPIISSPWTSVWGAGQSERVCLV
eukprot:1370394-Rhodomonas_salina.1